jgi:hypothetical protein
MNVYHYPGDSLYDIIVTPKHRPYVVPVGSRSDLLADGNKNNNKINNPKLINSRSAACIES